MSKRSKGRDARADLDRVFEGPDVLEELLELAGSKLDSGQVAARIQEAVDEGKAPAEVFPTFFEGPPRFPDASSARQLYGNLFGLWDAIASGELLEGAPQTERPPREKKPKPVAPQPFTDAPDDAFIEAAWRFLEDDKKARDRLFHAFENKQDPLLGWLDEQGLSDEGYGVARHLLFELSAMIELGWPAGLRTADPSSPSQASPPEALARYADEALFEAEQDEELPLPPAEAGRVRTLVQTGLAALWRARKSA